MFNHYSYIYFILYYPYIWNLFICWPTWSNTFSFVIILSRAITFATSFLHNNTAMWMICFINSQEDILHFWWDWRKLSKKFGNCHCSSATIAFLCTIGKAKLKNEFCVICPHHFDANLRTRSKMQFSFTEHHVWIITVDVQIYYCFSFCL